MSLTMNVLPSSRFVFSRQPIGIEATTDNLISTSGVKFSRTITFINAPTTGGVVFEITWNSITVSMTSTAGVMEYDGLHYRKKALVGETLADWIAHFASDIGGNFYIARDFDITYTTTTLTLTAKLAGAAYNVTFTDIPGTLTTDYTLGVETTGVTEVERSNFKVFLDVFFAADDIVRFEMFRTDKMATGYYETQIQKAIHSKITSPFPSMNNVADVMILEPGELLIKYWLRYFEFYGETAVPAYYYINTNSGNYYYAVMGGHYREKNQAFLLSYPTTIKYLTFQPRTKYVTKDQPEWLYWFIPNSDCLTGNLRLIIYNTDDTTTTVDFPWDISGESELRAMYKAVGYFQIVEPNIEIGKTVSYWTVQIKPTDEVEPTTAGETFTYYPVTDITPWYKHLVYRNSFGAYDTYRASGVLSTGMDITGQILKKWLDDDYIPSDGTSVNSEFDNVITHSLAISFTDKEVMIDLLRELFVYPKAAFVEEDVDADDGYVKVIPLVIDPRSIKIKESDDMVFSFEFSFNQALEDKGVFEIVS